MSSAGVARKGYIPIAGQWYDPIVYPYPRVYHKFLNKKTFIEIYPELKDNTDEDSSDEEIVNTDNEEDLSGIDQEI